MHNLSEILSGPGRSIAIAGHVHPDGDCIGSCVGLLLYIEENYPCNYDIEGECNNCGNCH
jgi:phosphoesterase RecJ-like protein